MKADDRAKMHDAIRATANDLITARGCTHREAYQSISSTYQENLKLSLGTSMEHYWRAMLQVADEEMSQALAMSAHDARVTPIRSLPESDR